MSDAPPLLVFDLDGTLAETAGDLIGTLNFILQREGIAPLPLAEARFMLGAGARALIQRGYAAQKAPLADESEALSRGAHAKFLQRTDLVYSMWEHGGDGVEQRLVGGSGLHRIDWSVPRFEIGYWCRSGHTGQGLVTEAVVALARMAFDVLGAQRVEIRMDDNNVASWKVAERAGFTFEGRLRRDTLAVDGAVRDTRVYARVRGVEEPAAQAAAPPR